MFTYLQRPEERGGRLARVIALGALVAQAAGCMAMAGTNVPEWAMHIRPAPVDESISGDEVARRLTVELGAPGLRDGHLGPEQIALAAVIS